MSFLSRLLRTQADPRDRLRPLWHTLVGKARDPHWYARCGVADSVEGRFDMITAVLAMVMLRMERSEALAPLTAPLTELFVEDMDGQLRQSGVGDLVVGKKMGRLMEVMGGRLGAFRKALPEGEEALAQVVARNVTMTDSGSHVCVASGLAQLARRLEQADDGTVLAGEALL